MFFDDTVKALNSALLSSGKALISGQKLGDQLFLCSKSPQQWKALSSGQFFFRGCVKNSKMGWVQVSSFWFSFIFFLSFSQSYHNRTHLGLTKTLSRISNNLSHDQTHTGEKPRQCKHCDKTLCKIATLRNHFVKRFKHFFHEQNHTGKKSHSFTFC